MKKIFASFLLASALAALSAPSFAASDPTDRARIEHIVEAFRVAIIKKDQASFLKLLHNESIPRIGIVTDKSLAHEKAAKKNPADPDPKKVFEGNARKFIEGIVKSPDRLEEKFENVRIDSDGDVAQVFFDYSFNANDYKENWGKESWHLVRTTDGWKISSVIWSMEFNNEPPPKKPEPKKS
jgi:hypothetical protein